MGLRETRKQATRARVLAAARDLFEEVGDVHGAILKALNALDARPLAERFNE